MERKLYILNAEEFPSLREKGNFSTKIYPLLRIFHELATAALKSLESGQALPAPFRLAFIQFMRKPDVLINYKQALL